ncbi:MAG: DUF998 domain-containing protein [Roseiflexaceae bacterium]
MTDKKITEPLTTISLAARLSIAAVIAYQAILIALIFIRPDLDPSWHTISEWAIGPHGWIMSMAFLISAVSYGSLFVAIKSQLRGIWGGIGLGILFICFIGTVGVGVFTTDPLESPPRALSTTGTLHILFGGSALMLLPFAALLINLSLALKNKAWLSARRVLVWTAGLPLLGLVGFLMYTAIFVVPLGPEAYGPGVNIGWPPRFALVTYMVWLITLAWQAINLKDCASLGSV